jgi:hypothetical protein
LAYANSPAARGSRISSSRSSRFDQGFPAGSPTKELGLWAAAAGVLDTLAAPPGWSAQSGLAVRHVATLAGTVGAVLHEAALIEVLARRRRPAEKETLQAVLSRSRIHGTLTLDTVVSVLLARLPAPGQILALATAAAGSERSIEQTIDMLGASLSAHNEGASDPRKVVVELDRLVALTSALETGAPPERLKRLDTIRREASSFCLRSFDRAVEQMLTSAETAMSDGLRDDVIGRLEVTARDLRRLETIGRKLGEPEQYETILATAAASLGDAQGDLCLVDRVHLVEILSGPDAAMALLAKG